VSDSEKIVDARGLLCPWPVLRLSRAVRELGGPGRILLLADDPAAAAEVGQLCLARGWELSEAGLAEPDGFNVVIR
jgi:tRNA 2-thiouridine synthesizing protein A